MYEVCRNTQMLPNIRCIQKESLHMGKQANTHAHMSKVYKLCTVHIYRYVENPKVHKFTSNIIILLRYTHEILRNLAFIKHWRRGQYLMVISRYFFTSSLGLSFEKRIEFDTLWKGKKWLLISLKRFNVSNITASHQTMTPRHQYREHRSNKNTFDNL